MARPVTSVRITDGLRTSVRSPPALVVVTSGPKRSIRSGVRPPEIVRTTEGHADDVEARLNE